MRWSLKSLPTQPIPSSRDKLCPGFSPELIFLVTKQTVTDVFHLKNRHTVLTGGEKWMNMKIGIMNIQMRLQIKRLQPRPCPLCVFPQILKGELSWEKRSSAQQVLKKEPQSIYSKYAQHEYCVYSQEEDDSGNLQLGSSSFSYGLREELRGKRLILINFSAQIFEMGNTNMRKRQTSPMNYSLRIVRG